MQSSCHTCLEQVVEGVAGVGMASNTTSDVHAIPSVPGCRLPSP